MPSTYSSSRGAESHLCQSPDRRILLFWISFQQILWLETKFPLWDSWWWSWKGRNRRHPPQLNNHQPQHTGNINTVLSPSYTGLFKMIIAVQLSSGNSAPNSGNNRHLTIPFRRYAQFQETWCVCIPELKVRIRTAIETITADMLQTVWNELDCRVDVCRITNGAHIEHL